MRYDGNDNYGKPKLIYVNRISNMSGEELYEETKSKIYLSAYANNNAESDYHWQSDACYNEWSNRKKLDQYSKAWKAASSN